MSNFHKNWQKFLTEETQQISEVTEEEFKFIEAARAIPVEKLAFTSIFGDKKRLVRKFDGADPSLPGGQFIEEMNRFGYQIDWKNGMLQGVRQLKDFSVKSLASSLVTGRGGATNTSTKVIKMKIGKWLLKVHTYITNAEELREKVRQANPETSFTGNDVVAAIGEKGNADLDRNDSYLQMMVGDAMYHKVRNQPKMIEKMIDFWKTNASYIRNNIEDLMQSSTYTAIITRDPIDVWRMSDFKQLDSCHRPVSAGEWSQYNTNEFVKCAVAEAHGHGALVYMVKTEELLETTGAETLEEAEVTLNQQDEIFADEARLEAEGELNPIARIRLRQVKYYTHKEEAALLKKYGSIGDLMRLNLPEKEENDLIARIKRATSSDFNPFDGVELAVPIRRIYGLSISGFRNWVIKWARDNQKEALERIPKERGVIDASDFIQFGGSYADTKMSALLSDLTLSKVKNNAVSDTETEDKLEKEWSTFGDPTALLEAECESIKRKYNYGPANLASFKVDFTVDDDGAGGAYVTPMAEFKILWDTMFWKRLPFGSDEINYILSDMAEMGYGWIDGWNQRVYKDSRGNIVFSVSILTEGLPGFAKDYVADSYDFEMFCKSIKEIDDLEYNHSVISTALEGYFKRDGLMEGGYWLRWADEIDNDETGVIYWTEEHDENDGTINAKHDGIEIDISRYADEKKNEIKWSIGEGYRQANIDNYEVARIWFDAFEGPFEVESTEESIAGNYDSFAQAKEAIEMAFRANDFKFDRVKSVLISRKFSILLKTKLAKPAMELVDSEMYPPNFEVEDTINTDDTATLHVSVSVGDYVPDGAVRPAKEMIKMWDNDDIIKQAMEEILDVTFADRYPHMPVRELEEEKVLKIERIIANL